MAFCQGVAQELFTVPIWIIEIASNNSFSTQSDSTAWRASDISLHKAGDCVEYDMALLARSLAWHSRWLQRR
jgi:hypothetical protein